MKSVKGLLLALAVLVLSGSGGAYLYWRWCVAPLPIGAQVVDIEILPGDSLRGTAEKLQARGVLQQSWDLVLYARLHEAAGSMRAGEYRVEPGTTLAGLLDLIRSGKVVMHALTLVEGWNFKQVLAAVEQEPNLRHTLAGAAMATWVERLGLPYKNPEGLLFPDTYEFPRATTDLDFLQRAYSVAAQRLTAAWQNRAAGLPYQSPYEALIMASIIEKETGQPAERAEIAGVFVRRLQKGMKLQTDPTVIYGLGDRYNGDITYQDLRTDTPYNTYTRYGLPPTPICMPGAAALDAALHPAAGKALYFVARGDGTHQFSATLVEQNAAVHKYQLAPHHK
jgi:UPF0755 protein